MTAPHQVTAGIGDAREAHMLLSAAVEADGVEPFGEAFVRGLDDDGGANRHFHSRVSGELAGVAATDGAAAELAVAPGHRRAGIGAALLARVLEAAPDAGVWAHGDLPAARALAASAGLEVGRELLQMSITGGALRAAAAGGVASGAPDGLRLETFPEARARMGEGAVDDAWLAVNNEAFNWHPEQGGWSADDLGRARDTAWFDPAGVLFAVDDSVADHGGIVGFHWTKRHGADVGEVYVIGLAAAARGRGAGGWLTRAGLAHLVEGGVGEVILYVEGDNAPAVATYVRTGFTVSRRDVMYRRS